MEHDTSLGNRHILPMVLCCLIPVVALGAIFVLKIPAPQVLRYGLILLCPLSHLLMMALMGRGQHNQPANAADRLGAETSVAQPTRNERNIVSIPSHSRGHRDMIKAK